MTRAEAEQLVADVLDRAASLDGTGVDVVRSCADLMADRGLIETPECQHSYRDQDDDGNQLSEFTCDLCGEDGMYPPCGVCNSRFCNCVRYGLR